MSALRPPLASRLRGRSWRIPLLLCVAAIVAGLGCLSVSKITSPYSASEKRLISIAGKIRVLASPTPFQPEFTDIHLPGPYTVSLTWTSTNSQNYSLQQSTNLSVGLWDVVPPHTNMPGLNGTMTVNTPITNSIMSYFRVAAD